MCMIAVLILVIKLNVFNSLSVSKDKQLALTFCSYPIHSWWSSTIRPRGWYSWLSNVNYVLDTLSYSIEMMKPNLNCDRSGWESEVCGKRNSSQLLHIGTGNAVKPSHKSPPLTPSSQPEHLKTDGLNFMLQFVLLTTVPASNIDLCPFPLGTLLKEQDTNYRYSKIEKIKHLK